MPCLGSCDLVDNHLRRVLKKKNTSKVSALHVSDKLNEYIASQGIFKSKNMLFLCTYLGSLYMAARRSTNFKYENTLDLGI